MSFVLDASITLSWCLPDEGTSRTDGLLQRLTTDAAEVPAQWAVEVLNGLVVGERRKRLTETDSSRFLLRLAVLPISVDPESDWSSLARTLELSRKEGLTAYDACYLELAIRRGLPMATDDVDLTRAARSVGVQVL